VSLNRLIEQVAELTRARWRDLPQERGIDIELQMQLAPHLPEIMGAEGEIRDALTNLIFNAIDAMPQGGRLALRSRAVDCTDSGTEAPQRHVHIEVGDSGIGMSDETRRRCLEPFFTTKGERGTGLGLAMVYGMVQRHSAELEIDSSLGHGTTMRVIFPACEASQGIGTPQPTPLLAAQRLSILLVDDDPLLIKSLRDILEGDGHLVTAADGGQRGIEMFTTALAQARPFDVVITDLGMPHVDGRKVAVAIGAASPSTPVILLTGWGKRLLAENDRPAHVFRVLSKPPKLQELRTVLASVDPASTNLVAASTA